MNSGAGKIVFRDIGTLKTAIQRQIDGAGIFYQDTKAFYNDLDPFQDGNAYMRTGFILKRIRGYIERGIAREEVLERAMEDFQEHLIHKGDKANDPGQAQIHNAENRSNK
jgi:hypothetical protein